jgi:tetratricopeptide (TPR) repeat protein
MSVAYVAGNASARSDSGWVGLSTGDSLSAEDTLQLSEGAFVELKWTSARLALSQKGVYKLHDVLAYSRTLGSAGADKALLSSMQYILSSPGHIQNAPGGARASLDSGAEYVRAEQYDQAIKQFLQAQDAATDSEMPEIQYRLSYSYLLEGDSRKAIEYASGLRPSRADEWSSNFVILKAKLLIDSSAFPQEVAWLTRSENDLSRDAQRSSVYLFLLGLGYRGVCDVSNEKLALSKVMSISGESVLGKSAALLLLNP